MELQIMQFLADYGLFLAKIVTLVAAILIIVGGIFAAARKGKSQDKHKLEIKKLNKKYDELADVLREEIFTKDEHKKLIKEKKAQSKAEEKSEISRKRCFVLHFNGDIKASAVNALREEITALLKVASSKDEVVVCLESPGGMVSPYGLAASQLKRIRQKQIPLTIIVDKIAASGGYLMACVADRILAAPFAIIGSIGVVGQLPNFHRLLKKKDIDFEQITAGKYKRTLTMFGENTEKGREKFKEDLEDIHNLFKDFIHQNRPIVNVEQVATGEHWLATRALELKLVDDLTTSDDYLLAASETTDIYQLSYTGKKSFMEKLSTAFHHAYQSMRGMI